MSQQLALSHDAMIKKSAQVEAKAKKALRDGEAKYAEGSNVREESVMQLVQQRAVSRNLESEVNVLRKANKRLVSLNSVCRGLGKDEC